LSLIKTNIFPLLQVKTELLTAAEHRLNLKAQISVLEQKIKDQVYELELAHTSSKMALKEKGQLRNEVQYHLTAGCAHPHDTFTSMA
jgi:hypothetical protein